MGSGNSSTSKRPVHQIANQEKVQNSISSLLELDEARPPVPSWITDLKPFGEIAKNNPQPQNCKLFLLPPDLISILSRYLSEKSKRIFNQWGYDTPSESMCDEWDSHDETHPKFEKRHNHLRIRGDLFHLLGTCKAIYPMLKPHVTWIDPRSVYEETIGCFHFTRWARSPWNIVQDGWTTALKFNRDGTFCSRYFYVTTTTAEGEQKFTGKWKMEYHRYSFSFNYNLIS